MEGLVLLVKYEWYGLKGIILKGFKRQHRCSLKWLRENADDLTDEEEKKKKKRIRVSNSKKENLQL